MTDLPSLAEAARAERDHRAASYPARIAARKSDPEQAVIDYQCWCAIAGWLDTGRFIGFHGGAEPESDAAPYISWPELEAAAEGALTRITTKCDKLFAGNEGEGETYAEASARRARLVCIHRKVQLRRQMVDSINAELREPTQKQEIAA